MSNHNQGYPTQQPDYNIPPHQYDPPPIGFQIPMNAPPYAIGGVPLPGSFGAVTPYPQQSIAPPYGAVAGQQYYAPPGQYQSGPPALNQYSQTYGQPAGIHSYGNTNPTIPTNNIHPNALGSLPYDTAGYGNQHSNVNAPYTQFANNPAVQGTTPVNKRGSIGNAYSQIPSINNPQNAPGSVPYNTSGQYQYQTVNAPYPQSTNNTAVQDTIRPSLGIYTNNQVIIDSIGSAGESYRGTIKLYPNFNAEQDCNNLRKAMKGIGTDEKAIIECLGRRNLCQRLEIKKAFKTMFGKDLIDELKSELSGNFSRAVIESLYDSDYYDAYSLFKAMEGAGTREDVLTEILTSRSNAQIENIKALFQKFFNKNLEKEVKSETSGFYRRVLVSCLQANKKELTTDDITRLRQQGPSAVVNIALARQEAQELLNAGEKKLGTDEACFIRIFATRNKYQLRATFEEYKKIANRDILSSIDREMSGDLASALKAIALQSINPALYFATRLHKSMKGLGTNDTALIRILLTRSEIDLENIKTEFKTQFRKTLESFVRGDTSGDYLKFLMRFVEGN